MPQEQRPTEKFRTSVGGQALMEGIMMRGPEKICCAVRRPDGTIDLSYSDVTTHWYNKVPLVRGVCNMVENLMNGYKYLMHSADIAMTEEEKEEETEKPQYPFGNFEGKRILLVEDNSLNREIATVLLEETGAVVEEAENGLVAVNMVKNSSPGYYDLVFMDIQMPVMNGYDSTRHIRALERPDIKSMPIIAMSANAFAEDIKLCKESGMNEHIAKPIDFGKVLEILEKYL